MSFLKQRNGQFIMIAVLMIAIMMVSVAGVLYSAVTYYKHERWEEYLTVLDNVKISSQRLVEISLANYTRTLDNNILATNLNRWQIDLAKAYPGFGIVLTYSNVSIGIGTYNLTSQTSNTLYFSNASAMLNIDITSLGLNGYKFTASAFLGIVLNATYVNEDDLLIHVGVEKENSTPVVKLKKDNFFVNGTRLSGYSNSKLTHSYQIEGEVLRIIYTMIIPDFTPKITDVLVDVVDNRNIMVTASTRTGNSF